MLPLLKNLDGVLVAARAVEIPFPGQAFQPGDVIYSINTRAVRDLADLWSILDGVSAGERLVIQVECGGRLMFLAFKLE